MGNTALLYGTVRQSGRELHALGVIADVPGDIQIGKSQDMRVRITSSEHGVFELQLKYLSAVILVCVRACLTIQSVHSKFMCSSLGSHARA